MLSCPRHECTGRKTGGGFTRSRGPYAQGGNGIRVFRGGRFPAYLFPRVPENQKGSGIRQARGAEIHCSHGHLAAPGCLLFTEQRIDFNAGKWGMYDCTGAVTEEGEISMPHPDMFRDVLAKVSDRSVFTCTLDIAREHTFCIEELHKHFIPQDVPEHLLSVEAENGQVVIRGLEHTFNECFETGGKLVF